MRSAHQARVVIKIGATEIVARCGSHEVEKVEVKKWRSEEVKVKKWK